MSEPLDLDAIEAKDKARTPGKWVIWQNGSCYGWWILDNEDGSEIIAPKVFDDGNASFIAMASTAIPDLIVEVKRLRDKVDDLEAEIKDSGYRVRD